MHFISSCERRLTENSMDSTDIAAKSSGSSTPLEDNINVVVRVRPISEKEIKANDESITQFPGNGQILVSGGTCSKYLMCWQFNYSVKVKQMWINQSYFHTMLYLSMAQRRRTFYNTAALKDSLKWLLKVSTRRFSVTDKQEAEKHILWLGHRIW